METLEPRWALDASALRITEFVADNDESLLDYDGDSSDWLEIYNSGSTTVDLSGMHLTDRDDELDRWTFPAGTTLAGGGYLVVFASNKDTVMPNGELHASFALSAGGEYLALTDASQSIIDQYQPEYPSQFEDVSYGRAMQPTGGQQTLLAAGAQGRAWRPVNSSVDAAWRQPGFNDASFSIVGPTGFGYENNPGDGTNYVDEINTTVPSGSTSIYLRVPFSLSSLGGVDRLTLRMMYDDGFVAYLNGVKIAEANAPDAPQWNSTASGSHSDSQAEQFQEFDVSAGIPQLQLGENVLAIHALNLSNSSDMLVVPELVAHASSLVEPEQIGFFEVVTPGYGNVADTFSGFAAAPEMSVAHGFYDTTQHVTLASATPGATIVYTTDGSTPEVDGNLNPVNGSVAAGPIAVSATTTLRARTFRDDYKPSFVTTATYIFLDDVIQQSPNGETPGPGWAVGNVNGQSIDYGIDPDIIAQYGANAVKESLSSLPTISITTDLANLFDAATGIYVNATNRGRDWERPASVELIDPTGGAGFTINAGLRIRGGYSRNDFNPKHAFRFYFRGDYGATRLEFPLFGDEGADEFDVLDLRTAQNYSWSSEGNSQNSFLREVFGRDLQRDLGHAYTRSRYYHLYLDGVYWGLFQTQERVEEYYAETYFGGDEADYDVVKAGLGDVGGTELSAGNDEAWRQLFDYAEALANNPAGNANLYWTMQGLNPDGTRNTALPVLLDVDNLIDYMSIIFLTGGYDTGLSRFLGDNLANNWFGVYNRETADRGFQFFIHDNEHSLGAGDGYHGTVGIDRTGPFNNGNEDVYEQFNPQYLHQDLLDHPEYRQRFIDRVQTHFFNDGPMTVARNSARVIERYNQVAPAIIAEAARWGDAQTAIPRNQSDWTAEAAFLIRQYFPTRNGIVLNQLRADGLFTHFAAPSFSQHGGSVPAGFELAMTASPGVIYYTTDGETDPRQIGGGVNGSAAVQVYSGPIELAGDVTIRARLRTNSGEWSGLVEADFSVSSTLAGDYDRSGAVAGADFLLWQRTLGTSVPQNFDGADGNGNSIVDAGDLAVWAGAFGNGGNDVQVAALAPSSAPAADSALPANVWLTSPTAALMWTDESDDSLPLAVRDGSDALLGSSAPSQVDAQPAAHDAAMELVTTNLRREDQQADADADRLGEDAPAVQIARQFVLSTIL